MIEATTENTRDQRVMSYKRGLEEYLEIEKTYRKLFSKLNYCARYCVKTNPPKEDYNYMDNVGCCIHDFPGEETQTNKEDNQHLRLLGRERESLHEKRSYTEFDISPCPYHSIDEGCLLKSHKPVICQTYICGKLFDYIQEKLDSKLPNLHRSYEFLSNVLRGNKTKEEITEFEKELNFLLLSI